MVKFGRTFDCSVSQIFLEENSKSFKILQKFQRVQRGWFLVEVTKSSYETELRKMTSHFKLLTQEFL